MSVFSIPPVVMAGITLYIGLYHLMIYSRRRQYRENLTFALACFVISSYDVFCAGLYSADSVTDGFPWQRAQVISLAGAAVAFMWFVNDYVSRKPGRWTGVLSAYFLLSAVAALLVPKIFWSVDQPAVKHILLSMGLKITYHEMTPGLLANVQSVAGVAVFVYALWLGIRFYRAGQRKKALPLLVATLLLFAGVFNDTAVSSGLYSFIYVIEYVYMAMVLLMADSLSEQVAQAAIMKDALQESEARYRIVSELSSDFAGAYRVKPDGGIVCDWMGGAYTRITGYAAEETNQYGGWASLVHPADVPIALQHLQALLANREDVCELRIVTRNGESRWLRNHGRPVWDEAQQRVTRLYGASQDITERKQAEALLRESEERFRTIVDGLNDALFIHNVETGAIIDVNRRMCELYGYTREEARQLDVGALGSGEKPYTRSEAMEWMQKAREGEPQVFEWRTKDKQGHLFWVEVNMRCAAISGRDRILVAVRDISERKRVEEALRESEEHYRAVVEQVSEGIVLYDMNTGCVLETNAAYQALLGYTAEEMQELTFYDIIAHDRDSIDRYVQRVVTERHIFIGERQHHRKDGSMVDVEVSAHLITYGGREAMCIIARDIAERKRSAKALRESEEQYRTLFESSPESITLVGLDGTILDCNEATTAITGVGREHMMGRPFVEMGTLNTEDLPRYVDLFSRALSGEKISPLQIEITRSGGEARWLEVFPALLRQGDQVSTIQVITRDITERKRAEEALRESEERLSLVLEGSKDGFWDWNIATGAVQFDRRWAEMLGYNLEEIEPHVRAWEELIHPADEPGVTQRLQAHLEGRIPYYEMEHRLRAKSGEWKWILDRGKVVARDENGKPLRMAGTHTDIAERKSAEAEREQLLKDMARYSAQLQTAAQISKSAITILDPAVLMQQTVDLIRARFGLYYVGIFLVDGSGEYAVLRAGTGEAGRQMLAAGHRLAIGDESMIGWCIAHSQARIALDVGVEAVRFDNPYLPEARSEMALPLLTRGRAIGALTVQSVQEMAFSEDDVTALQTMADQLATAIENARLYEASQQEIARRRQAEDQVRKLNEELERRVVERTAQLQAATQELETFAYSVSHDLKAPLRGIDGYSRILLEDYASRLDEEGRRFLGNIRQAAQRMAQLIDDLLAYSRVERHSFTAERVNLRALVETLVAERADDLRARNVSLTIDIACESAPADAAGLAQVLRNLVDNAIKFTRDVSEPRIEIGGREAENACILWVRDNGIGFDMQYRDRILDIFQRLHRPEDYPGTGIGLAIVRKAVQRMGGRVWAEGAPGAGSAFYLEIPR